MYAVRRLKLAAIKRRFTEEERREIGNAVAAHFEQCGWQVFYDRKEMHSTGGMNARGQV
jgi:hypothetical protein